eukprot:3245637-Rhodomonas_salina.1
MDDVDGAQVVAKSKPIVITGIKTASHPRANRRPVHISVLALGANAFFATRQPCLSTLSDLLHALSPTR